MYFLFDNCKFTFFCPIYYIFRTIFYFFSYTTAENDKKNRTFARIKQPAMTTFDEIEQIMLSMKDEGQRTALQRFFKTGKGQYGEGDLFLGIKVPQTRAVAKRYWSQCTLDDLDILVRSPYHEVRLLALLMTVLKYKHDRKNVAYADFYLSHTAHINNWDLVDLSCYEILGHWLLDKDRAVLYSLARSGNFWEQRIAIVSCMAFVRHGQYDDCLAIADLLLHHPHDLIQKAVGWLLREVGKRDSKVLTDFLVPRYKSMPRTMLRYAIEKYPEVVRKQFLKGSFGSL